MLSYLIFTLGQFKYSSPLKQLELVQEERVYADTGSMERFPRAVLGTKECLYSITELQGILVEDC